MAARGFAQAEVDDMELWVIAGILGVNAVEQTTNPAPVTAAEHAQTSRDLLRQRVARAAAGTAAAAARSAAAAAARRAERDA